MKLCTRCRDTKPYSSFYVRRAATDGLTDFCKTCHYTSIRKSTPGVRTRRNRTFYVRLTPIMRAMRLDPTAKAWFDRILGEMPEHVQKEIFA